MGIPRFEIAGGAVNGTNLVFTTSVPYTAGTVAVYLNGQLLLNGAGNPWTETNPATGVVTLHSEETPETGDVVAMFFLDTLEAYTGEEVEELNGTILDKNSIGGTIATSGAILASLDPINDLTGTIFDANLTAQLVDTDRLTGILED